MSHRLVSSAMWADPRVRVASLQARAVLAWLMGGPARTSLPGLVPIGPLGLAEAMPCKQSDARRALRELERAGLVEVDASAPLIRVVDAVTWEPPPPPKVIHSWRRLDLPARPIVRQHLLSVRHALENNTAALAELEQAIPHLADTVPDTVSDTLSGALRARAPAASSYSSSSSHSQVEPIRTTRRGRRVPEQWNPNEEHRQFAQEHSLDLDGELAKFRDHEFAQPKTDWDATFRNWLRRAADNRLPKLQIARGPQFGQPNHPGGILKAEIKNVGTR